MAVVKNTFTTVIENTTSKAHIINGLTSETSTTNLGPVCPEPLSYFLRAIYQTLIDAGYSDAVMSEDDYSITVLGFKFFIIMKSNMCPFIYAYGSTSNLQGYSDANVYSIGSMSNIKFTITVRGDKNCVCIYFGSYNYPNAENGLMFVAKAKNLATSEEAFAYGSQLQNGSTSYGARFTFRNKSDLYTLYNDQCYINSGNGCNTFYDYAGLNTQSKFICEPVIGFFGSFFIYSLLKSNSIYFVQGKYYKIGTDIYFYNGYMPGTARSYSGAPFLFKVSD